MIPYARGISGSGPPMRRTFQEDYNYDHQPSRGGIPTSYGTMQPFHGGIPPPSMASKWSATSRNMFNRPVDVNCGELRAADRGIVVRMTGRVQYQRLNRFISLRDSHGTTQLVALEERLNLIKRIRNLPLDSHIEIIGTVEKRPINTINTAMTTGEIEVIIDEIVDVAAPKRKFVELSGEEAPGRTGKKARSSVLITSGEISRCETEAVKKKFHQRTHNCGELNELHVNLDVVLCGWIESKRNDRFVILRDGYGAAQLVITPNDFMVSKALQSAEQNTLITVKGKVSKRPSHQRNTRMATGSIEVKVTDVEIIDPNEPVPDGDVDEKKVENQEVHLSGPPSGDVNSYTSRTHTCGELRGNDVGKEVVLCGWLHSQRTNRFVIIRDGHGSTQLLIPTKLESTLGKELNDIPLESVIMVTGVVCARPPEQVTEKVSTGEIEVVMQKFEVLNMAKRDLPFPIREHNRPKEHLRMKYRYLDMRFTDMQYRLRLRSKVLMRMREFLINHRGFVEIETPTLFKRTPGGAQEYVVPTRTENEFYSLVQSPQQLKQLLMIGSMDRYFQVARCYRDEGARPDRQPEFTQMDIELSFTERKSIMNLIEDLLKSSWPEDMKTLNTPFPVISYHDAMHMYGTDKPDISFDKKLVDISELIDMSNEQKETLQAKIGTFDQFTAKALVFGPNNGPKLKESFKKCEELQLQNPKNKAKLYMVKCTEKWKEVLVKVFPFIDAEKLKTQLEFMVPCTIVVGLGKETDVLPLLGKLRQDVFGNPTSNFHFLWVIDFPLFLEGDDGQLESAHHPFTQALKEDEHLLFSDPLKVRSLHFDLVLNGCEVGGGSVRIHDPAMQTRVLKDLLKIPVNALEHMLEALALGAPPHGGIALGIDRLLSIMVGTESIRDVIAFPKGVNGRDPLSGAPCPISEEEKKMYHLIPK